MALADGAAVFEKGFFDGLRPDPVLTVSEWADRHRYLSQRASAEPGRFQTSRTPYLREIMDKLSSNDPTQRVVFMKGAQVGGTEAGNCWLAYSIDCSPAPFLAVSPTLEMAKRNSRTRIDPMIEECPRLRESTRPKGAGFWQFNAAKALPRRGASAGWGEQRQRPALNASQDAFR